MAQIEQSEIVIPIVIVFDIRLSLLEALKLRVAGAGVVREYLTQLFSKERLASIDCDCEATHGQI